VNKITSLSLGEYRHAATSFIFSHEKELIGRRLLKSQSIADSFAPEVVNVEKLDNEMLDMKYDTR
jgi:hypothetical protein